MQIFAFIIILLSSPMVSSLPLIESQTTPVLSNVSKLNADIHRLAKLGANFTGDANQLASLDASVTVLKSDILKTTSSVKHSHLFNYDESVLITSALRDLARPVIQVLLDLIANKPTIIKLGARLDQDLHAQLVLLDSDTYNLFEELTRKINLSLFGALDTPRGQISAAFQQAIDVYS